MKEAGTKDEKEDKEKKEDNKPPGSNVSGGYSPIDGLGGIFPDPDDPVPGVDYPRNPGLVDPLTGRLREF